VSDDGTLVVRERGGGRDPLRDGSP
jgi:hypothetical protein